MIDYPVSYNKREKIICGSMIKKVIPAQGDIPQKVVVTPGKPLLDIIIHPEDQYGFKADELGEYIVEILNKNHNDSNDNELIVDEVDVNKFNPKNDEKITVPSSGIIKSNIDIETKIKNIDFSVRTKNCLYNANIKTLEGLINCSENDLLSLKNFGKTCLVEIDLYLKRNGLELKKD